MSSALKCNPKPLLSKKIFIIAVEIDQPTEKRMITSARFMNAEESDSSCHFFVKIYKTNIKCAEKTIAETIFNLYPGYSSFGL